MQRFLGQCLGSTALLTWLMAALVFHALIPAGFMPAMAGAAHDTRGSLVLQMCATRAGHISPPLGAPAPDAPLPDHAEDGASACGFALSALTLWSAQGTPVLASAEPSTIAVEPSGEERAREHPHIHPARGPPAGSPS